jgi:putative transposase
MARPLRLEQEGGYWHLTQRGNERRPIFLDDDDRRVFLQLLAATAKRFRWRVLTYVLMTNHYHLVSQTPGLTLSRGMHALNFRYAQYFNRKYKRCGHLFQGRFGSILIEESDYLNEVMRYVVLNPVRAGMVRHPAEYEWSSYRALAGLEPAPDWLAVDWVLALDRSAETARQIYRDYVDERREDKSSIWDGLTGQIYFGSAAWIERMRELVETKPRSDEHPCAQRLMPKRTMMRVIEAISDACEVTTEAIRGGRGGIARSLAAWLAREEAILNLREIAASLRLRSCGYISTLVRECEEQLARDKLLQSIAIRAIDALRA